MRKILFILGLPNPFSGAAWTRVGFFAENWSNKGYELGVLGTFDLRSLKKRGITKSDKVNIFNLILNLGIDHPLFFAINILISFLSSTFFLIVNKPEIVVVSMPTGDVGLGALMACRLLGVKCVVDYRDEWEDYLVSIHPNSMKFFYSFVKKVAALLYSKTQLVVVVITNFVQFLKRRGVNNVRLVPNGADANTFKPSSNKKSTGHFTIFYSGYVGEYYRLDIAVKALKRLKNDGLSNVKLVIAGSGEVQRITGLAHELGISNNIDYKGSISSKVELIQLMNESDLGLIPYDDNIRWKNALPAKFFEYCACGIPVIATTFHDSLLAGYIKKYEIGLISPPMNEEKLAEAIYTIYKNGSFRLAAGKRARALLEEKFDRKVIAENFLKDIIILIGDK